MSRTRSLYILGITLLLLFFVSRPALFAEETEFGGIGLQVVPTINGDLVVLNVLDDTPASERGLKPGDLIFKVDDVVLNGTDFGEIVSTHLWGAIGTSVVLYYRRPGVQGDKRVVVQRIALKPQLTVTPTIQDGSTPPSGGQQ